MKKIFILVLLIILCSGFVFGGEFEDTLKKAKQGDAVAQFILGGMYNNGDGVTQDYKQAIYWYKKAAEQGLDVAQYNLGLPESETAKESIAKQKILDESLFSNGKALGKWWMKNPKKFDPLPKPLLYHFEGNYSFSQLSGNVDSKSQTVSANLTLRKKFLTSNNYFELQQHETTISLFPDNTTKVETNSFGQSFSFTLTSKFSVIGGYNWNTNYSSKYIKDSKVKYGGLFINLFEYPKFKTTIIAAYGSLKAIYMNDSLVEIPGFIPVDPYETEALYYAQTTDWQITDIISFNLVFSYLYCFEDANYHQWGADFKLKFKMTENISFFTNYNIEYGNNPLIESVNLLLDNANSPGRLDKKDSELSIGITIAI